MYNFEVLLVLLCSAVCGQTTCSRATVCVTNGNGREAECQQSQVIHGLSDLTLNETNCDVVHIYLTSGTHFLSRNLSFSATDTVIYGTPHGLPTTVECLNRSGISFNGHRRLTRKVSLSNITLSRCNTIRSTSSETTIRAALYFFKVAYTLSNVAVTNTVGYGLYADFCSKQVLINCTFHRNTKSHIQLVVKSYTDSLQTVLISDTVLHDGGSYGVNVKFSGITQGRINIVHCQFKRNKKSHLLVSLQRSANADITLENSVFTTSNDTGIRIFPLGVDNILMVTIRDSNFSNNAKEGLLLYASSAEITGCLFSNNSGEGASVWLTLETSSELAVSNCSVENNSKAGMLIVLNADVQAEVHKTIFVNNSAGISLHFLPLIRSSYGTTRISDCNFTDHRLNLAPAVVQVEENHANTVKLERCSFKRNKGLHSDCSILLAVKTNALTLSNVDITGNNCTGITLSASRVKLENDVNLTRNHGLRGGGLALKTGALSLSKNAASNLMRFSLLNFHRSSKLNIINNTADTYGGGIYSDVTCENRDTFDLCFFQFEDSFRTSQVLTLHGNSAQQGGDAVFGGCLSKCSVTINRTKIAIDKNYPNNTFWNLFSTNRGQSLSEILEDPKRAVFCTTGSVMCNDSYTVTVYRGQTFTVPLMVTDDFCTPSVDVIDAKVYDNTGRKNPALKLEGDSIIKKTGKYCYNFSYVLKGGNKGECRAKIGFSTQKQFFTNIPPVVLTVLLNDCPAGLQVSREGQCVCHSILKSYNIECNPSVYSLEIPPLIWMGELGEGPGSMAVQRDCQYCANKGMLTITNITRDSNRLCIAKRTGILCGACVEGHSLKLGGHECADCSDSTYKGVLLVLGFAMIGIALILLLLVLNLTVSTGIINGLIFYSNIVYLNSDTLLPTTREGNSTHLQNTVEILFTFQAWMNMDFGITTCFFDGYDTYISTWMQFVFPLYIWLLILAIVLCSRHSSRVSRVIKSNTVSVLATLLLLAYAKLLKTSIEVFSSVKPELLEGKSHKIFWKSDANILYLGQTHLPLFLMSIVMVIFYVIPFTLLIFLGPFLQANSHYRLLNWINRLKPFLDAFYGPYTSRYRYWPGLLLLARVAVLGTFAFYSLNDTPFRLLSISGIVAVLLVTWIAIGRTHTLSLHRKVHLNYIELFFMLNLGVFTAASVYVTYFSNDKVRNQQGLAVAMVGSTLAVFCGILVFQIHLTTSHTMRKIISRTVRKIVQWIQDSRKKRRDDADSEEDSQNPQENTSSKVTCTEVKMTECRAVNVQLREPLLDW